MMPPLVYIVVLHWKHLEQTRRCLRSLRASAYGRSRVLVVDNHSADGSLEALRQEFPEADYLPLSDNYGFAGGNNPGIRYALHKGADYVLLLNNDTLVPPEMMGQLVAAAETHAGLAVLSPKVVWEQRPDTLAGLGFRRRPYGFELVGWEQPDPGSLNGQPVFLDVVFGCAMLIKAAALRSVGLLDERFFFYYEDADFCTRVGLAGYSVAYLPSATVVHAVSGSTKGNGGRREFLLARSRQLFFAKHLRAGARLAYALHEGFDLLRMLAIYLFHGMHRAALGYAHGTLAGLALAQTIVGDTEIALAAPYSNGQK